MLHDPWHLRMKQVNNKVAINGTAQLTQWTQWTRRTQLPSLWRAPPTRHTSVSQCHMLACVDPWHLWHKPGFGFPCSCHSMPQHATACHGIPIPQARAGDGGRWRLEASDTLKNLTVSSWRCFRGIQVWDLGRSGKTWENNREHLFFCKTNSVSAPSQALPTPVAVAALYSAAGRPHRSDGSSIAVNTSQEHIDLFDMWVVVSSLLSSGHCIFMYVSCFFTEPAKPHQKSLQ